MRDFLEGDKVTVTGIIKYIWTIKNIKGATADLQTFDTIGTVLVLEDVDFREMKHYEEQIKFKLINPDDFKEKQSFIDDVLGKATKQAKELLE